MTPPGCPGAPVAASAAPVAAPAPVAAQDQPAAPQEYYYLYARPAGETRFLVLDISTGAVGGKKIYAPFYNDSHLARLRAVLQEMADENPDAAFQIRKADGKTVVFTALTMTPAAFAAFVAA